VAGAVEPGGEFRPFQLRVGDAPLAAHQGTEREFDPQGARTHLAHFTRAAELDALEHDGRRRKQPRIDVAGDAKVEPGQAAGARFELPAVLSPIDEKRPDQRRDQRQDDRNRKAEQRRLHAVTTTGPGPNAARWAEYAGAGKARSINELSTIPVTGP